MKFTLRTTLAACFTLAYCLLTTQVAVAQYCLPTYNNQCTSDDYINSVNFAGINNSGTGCGNPGASNYTNYTGAFTANMVINAPYTITVAPGPTWGQYFVAMIDFNQDGDFADPGEFFDIGYSLGGGTVSNTITAPCGALTGTTRLRIMCRYANTPLTQADICAIGLSFGEVEDYNVNITPASGTDGALVRFVSPVTACGMTANEIVRVKIKNVGGTAINGYTVCYSINNGPPTCQTVATVIPACDSVTHTFSVPANMLIAGQYDFDATLTVAGDGNLTNNSITNYYVDNIPVIGSLPYTQNFDVTNGGWTTSGVSSSWAWGVPTGTFINHSASPTKAWVTNLTGPYNVDELSYLTSPCFNMSSLTTAPYLSFSHIFDLQTFSDVGYVELTTNAGTTWTRLGTTGSGNNWYNNFSNAWDGNSGAAGAWRPADIQLTGAQGSSNVRVRFVMDSDAFTTLEGMGVDDVKLIDTLKNAGISAFVAPVTGCQLSATSPVSVTIKNYGSHSISNIPVCYTVNGGPSVCATAPGPIAAGATYTYTFAATANLSAPGAYNLVAYTNWSSDYTRLNDTLRTTVNSLPLVNTFPYKQTFEAGQGGWASGGTASNDWAYGTPAKATITGAASGTKAWVTAGLSPGSYQDNANNWVESPCFDLSTLTSPWVMAKVWWNAEFSWDGAVLEYSTNGGTSWTEIGAFGDPFNWYTDNTVNGLSTVGGSGNGWSGRASSSNGSGGYVAAKHGIFALAGQSAVRFRVHFATDGSVVDDGFAFDDFVVADPPHVRLGNDTTICAGNFTIQPNVSGGTYLWTGGATTPTLTVSTPGTYILQYIDTLGLSGADTIVITNSTTPAVNLGANQTVCHGDTSCLSVNALTYPNVIWSTGDTTSQICVTTTGTWSIQAVDAAGCTSRDSVTTTVVNLPTPNLGADTAQCANDTICIGSTCGPNSSYLWSNGATTQQICVLGAGTYTMTCTDVNGCAGMDTITISALPLPVASGSVDTSNCPIVQFTNTSTGTSQLWDFGDGNSSPTSNISHDYTTAGNGTYNVTLVSINDCGSDTVTFSVDVNCLVSIGGAMNNNLKLFPNPNQGKFKLETSLTGSAPVMVTITDLQGKAVFSRDFGQAAGHFSQEISLDVTKGVYFVKFDEGGQVTIKKLVIQ